MLFNSYAFVLFFLPTVLVGYYMINRFGLYRFSSLFLLGMSLLFYAYFNISYLPIILSSIAVNFLFYKIFANVRTKYLRKTFLIIAVVFNIGVLFYFKYYDFFIENINALFATDFALKNLIMPLGISFFTFQQLSFVIDSYKNETPKYDLLNYALFVTYFPQLIAGPIVTHDELIPQLQNIENRKLNWDNLAKGLYMFAMGMGKKVLIADKFGNAVNFAFADLTVLNSADAIVAMLAYTIQIYFDFSGYCDMATGIAKMMNIELPRNFDSPYKSVTIIEFWKRWHITLTRFFTKYVYIPLGGNRKGKLRMLANTMAVYLISGLWHGANWTFVVWGALHGFFYICNKVFKHFFEKLHPVFNRILTFLFINVTWIFFRAESVSDALLIIKKICMFDFAPLNSSIVNTFIPSEADMILEIIPNNFFIIAYFVLAFVLVFGTENIIEKADTFRPTVIKCTATVIVLVFCVFSLSGMSTFLYFNF